MKKKLLLCLIPLLLCGCESNGVDNKSAGSKSSEIEKYDDVYYNYVENKGAFYISYNYGKDDAKEWYITDYSYLMIYESKQYSNDKGWYNAMYKSGSYFTIRYWRIM